MEEGRYGPAGEQGKEIKKGKEKEIMQIKNVRCPLRGECGATVCDFEHRERECLYYRGNARDGYELPDQAMPDNFGFDEGEDKGELVWISIDKLHPHPDNPRKELGDLTELAESIKAKGILQNLTVVPFKSKTNPNFNGTGMYTIIIGHRRHAAAEIAGLAEVPCVITEMTEREQIQTMMLENMQRSDLTIYEQAQGFQMMLDLGETKESIAATTGFSRSTVDRRIKLLNIDGKKFKSAEERGATLEDYLKVAEIEDQKTRDKLTDMLGTNNFTWNLREAIKKQRDKKKLPIIKAEMKRLGIKLDENLRTWSNECKVVKSITIDEFESGCADDIVSTPGKELFFNTVQNDSVNIFKKLPKQKKEAPKKSEAEIHAIKLREGLKQISQKAYESRKEFILGFTAAKKYEKELDEWAFEIVKRELTGAYRHKDWGLICEATGEGYEKYMYQIKPEVIEKLLEENPHNGKLVVVAAVNGGSKDEAYFLKNYRDEVPTWTKNEYLDLAYKYLCKMGYEMSDEEKALQDGTHELFE
ncbi:MAG: ParB/RepB/Spo0J family partition protein [Ruminococcaceae bacterium]|nr:ParB/RepB/Spo0J family partition protein [Oscillospiraceae bacterium]